MPSREALIRAGRPALALVLHADRAPKRDHLSNIVRPAVRDLSGVDPTETPSDDADLAAVTFEKIVESGAHPLDGFGRWTDVAAQAPAVNVVTQGSEVAAQRARRRIGGHQAGEHENGVPVTARRSAQQRTRRDEHAEVADAAGKVGEE
jgi:hypothetical protein